MLTGTIDPIDEDIKLIIREDMSPQAASNAIAVVARETLTSALAENEAALGYLPLFLTIVDGVTGALESSVRPDGEIDYKFSLLDDLFEWIWEQLDTFSPVGTADAHPGLYKSSHVLFADGEQIKRGDIVPPASRYVFFNTQPYSRPIERGESHQAPNGVYEAIAVLAQQLFDNQAKISFSFISPEAGGIVDWAKTPLAKQLAVTHRGGRRELHHDWLTRVPAITIIPGAG